MSPRIEGRHGSGRGDPIGYAPHGRTGYRGVGSPLCVSGYGRTRDDKTGGPHGIEDLNRCPSVRYVSSQGFHSLQPSWMTLSANLARGDGGWCYGDSGSPNFPGDSNVMLSITAFNDSQCRSLDRGYRLDTESAREFMAAQGISLP